MRHDGATLNEIGIKYGLTRERVRQILGTEGKDSRYILAADRAKAFIAENPRACWNEVAAHAGASRDTLVRFGVKKENAPSRTRYWTRLMLLDAGRRWRDAHGKYPNSTTWIHHRTEGYPATATVYRYFGTWSEYMKALKENENAPV